MNNNFIARLLRIAFHAELTEQRFKAVGFEPDEYLFPVQQVWDLILDEAFGGRCGQGDFEKVYAAWNIFRVRFSTPAEFDPSPFIEWLCAASKCPEAFHQQPFQTITQPIWEEIGRRVMELACAKCGHTWVQKDTLGWGPFDKKRNTRCPQCRQVFVFTPITSKAETSKIEEDPC